MHRILSPRSLSLVRNRLATMTPMMFTSANSKGEVRVVRRRNRSDRATSIKGSTGGPIWEGSSGCPIPGQLLVKLHERWNWQLLTSHWT